MRLLLVCLLTCSININLAVCGCKKTYHVVCESVEDIVKETKIEKESWTELVVQPSQYVNITAKRTLTHKHVKDLVNLKRLVVVGELNSISLDQSLTGARHGPPVSFPSSLEEIFFYGNSLTTISTYTFFYPTHYLRQLSLKNNSIKEIEERSFVSMTADLVDLSGNQLSVLKAEIFSGSLIKELNLQHNKLTAISNGALPKNLTIIRLDHNKFLLLPVEQLSSAVHLEELTISHNKLSHIEDFSSLKLKRLDLSSNSLLTVGGTFDRLENLQFLSLKNNSLVEFTFPSFMNKPGIGINIYLSYNRLRRLKLDNFTRDLVISIRGNPWDCICFKDIEGFINKHKPVIIIDYCDLAEMNSGKFPICMSTPYTDTFKKCDPNQISDEEVEYFVKHVGNQNACIS